MQLYVLLIFPQVLRQIAPIPVKRKAVVGQKDIFRKNLLKLTVLPHN